jgi:rare lipoprotein A
MQGSAPVEVEAIVPGAGALASAPPQAPPSSPQPVTLAQAQPKGVYLQLGAFSARENAELFRVRMMREFAWLSETIQVIAGESLFRLHFGPYRTQEEARGSPSASARR